MNSSRPCTGYLPSTIVKWPANQCSTSCNSIMPISHDGLPMRLCRYRDAPGYWNVCTNASDERHWRATLNDAQAAALQLDQVEGDQRHILDIQTSTGTAVASVSIRRSSI